MIDTRRSGSGRGGRRYLARREQRAKVEPPRPLTHDLIRDPIAALAFTQRGALQTRRSTLI